MKIDHLVVNVDRSVQEDPGFIKKVHSIGLPYEPKRGKGTKGFKVSNIWIGDEYFEFVRIETQDGGGWIQSWTEKYHSGHRGLIGFALEVDDIETTYQSLISQGINVTAPESLKFRWFFNLLSKSMPWKNSYLPEFEGVSFQFFLQQLENEKVKSYMQKHMVPNGKEKNINGISEVKIFGALTEGDKRIIKALFQDYDIQEGAITISLGSQTISFVESETESIEVLVDCTNEKYSAKRVEIENVLITNK
ncbi:VOC family protein [Sporosarcina sp. ANT_H38]|uniref:VOC family protein n=1 Tax=Sporosarcina sp. ANT_H38 TaxID=2597358 RepID=UPI0011F311E4|nr:VOC family protein [Sporosarcina sp. ANT_H38]KAA0955917.1 VOC family protein [Sporosarcina sp. ANT_H38]